MTPKDLIVKDVLAQYEALKKSIKDYSPTYIKDQLRDFIAEKVEFLKSQGVAYTYDAVRSKLALTINGAPVVISANL